MSEMKVYAIDMDRHYGKENTPAVKENLSVTCFKDDYIWARFRVQNCDKKEYKIETSPFLSDRGAVSNGISAELY